MKSSKITQMLLFAVLAVALSGIAYAQECEGTLSGPTQQVYVGNPFNITFFNAEPASNGDDILINLPAGLTLTGSSPNPTVVNNIGPWTAYVWEVSSATADNYSVSVNISGSVNCSKSFGPFNVIDPILDPSLVVFVSDMTSLVKGQSYDELVTLQNLGPGIAYNVAGVSSTLAGQPLTPVSFAPGTIGNVSGVDDTYSFNVTLTPDTCGSNDVFNVNVNNYEDGEGNHMVPVSGSDSFDIIGSDLRFNSLTAVDVSQGTDTTISFEVENIGSLDASSVSVQVEVDGVVEGTVVLGPMAQGAVVSDSFVYSTASKTVGNHNITARIVATTECSNSNNEAQAVFTVSSSSGPVCGNGVCESGETTSSCSADCGSTSGGSSGGGGGSGGGSSRTFYLVLTEDNPEVTLPLRNGDTVKYDWAGESYSFFVRDVYSDRMKFGVSKDVSYNTYDMNTLTKYDLNLDDEPKADLGVRPVNQGNSNVDITFSLMDSGMKRVIDILPPGSVDRRVVDVGSGSSEETVPVESGPVDYARETIQDYAEGALTFVEELSMKSKAPVWGGLLLALVIILLGSGIYFAARKEKEE